MWYSRLFLSTIRLYPPYSTCVGISRSQDKVIFVGILGGERPYARVTVLNVEQVLGSSRRYKVPLRATKSRQQMRRGHYLNEREYCSRVLDSTD